MLHSAKSPTQEHPPTHAHCSFICKMPERYFWWGRRLLWGNVLWIRDHLNQFNVPPACKYFSASEHWIWLIRTFHCQHQLWNIPFSCSRWTALTLTALYISPCLTQREKLISYKGLVVCNESARWLFLLLVLLSSAASQLVSVSWFRGCGGRGNSCPGFIQHYTRGVRMRFPSPVAE